MPSQCVLMRFLRIWLMVLLVCSSMPAIALKATDHSGTLFKPSAAVLQLNHIQSTRFRQWFSLLIQQQVKQPSPRWYQKDCVGLVRFAAIEALKPHDTSWLKANGMLQLKRPEDVALNKSQLSQLNALWLRGNERSAYISASEMVAYNTVFIGTDLSRAAIGDLLYFDQGNAQHIMIWMGSYIAYHTGTARQNDSGMRAYSIPKLLRWQDTRWRPDASNPNFKGIYRLYFLTGHA